MLNFEYYAPTRVFFGDNEEEKLGKIIKSYGFKKVLIHYGKASVVKSGLLDRVISLLKAENIDFITLGGVEANPKLKLVLEGIKLVKESNVDFILAIGGGSVIDSAKAISNGSKVDFSPWLFSTKKEVSKDHLPLGVILTISAAGSDMSDSCVITNEETKEKRGFNSPHNRPLFAILDPKLTYTVSKYQTACGVVDIMMHTLERYISIGPDDTDLTDNIAIGVLKTVYKYGLKAVNEPDNYEARANIMWANSISHNGITGMGRPFVMSAHQLEHELSGMYDEIAHGAGLAVIWPAWAMVAYKASISRFKRLSYEVLGITPSNDVNKDIEAGISKLKDFFKELGMPVTLREFNIPKESIDLLAKNTTVNQNRVIHDVIDIDYETALKILELAY